MKATMRLRLICVVACGLFLAGQAQAQGEPKKPADVEDSWSESLRSALAVSRLPSDLERGREIYATCAECHLASGAGLPDGTMPQLAGQHRNVLIKQLMDIRSGARNNPLMRPFVLQLEDTQDLVDVAAYIEALPVQGSNGKGPRADIERGANLYREACARCHGDRGQGNAEAFYPMLAGQHYRYIVRQLIDIASGRRGNANLDMVISVEGLSARDIANVADYVARLAPTSPESGR
jgi:cytochrome c553